jgi:subtilisin family serine protease
MVDAGIIVCIAAGNRRHKIDIVGGDDYDNYAVTDAGTVYYHRGSSPYSSDAIVVGSIASTVTGPGAGGPYLDSVADYSEKGPGVHIYAPGTNIMSACSNTFRVGFAPQNYQANFQNNASFKQMNISGTSMAAPQVAGVSAILLQMYPNIPSGSLPSTIKGKLLEIASSSLQFTGLDNDYSNLISTQTTEAGKLLFNPYSQNEPLKFSGTLSFAGVGLEFR